jgi:hypothetical protein
MTAGAAALRMRPALAPASAVAAWLLAATVLDLILTRLASRMMIFAPKDPALAGPAAAVGRLAAFADALVPLVGLVLLVALIDGARRPGTVDRIGLTATAGVAVAGVLAIAAPPSPWMGAGAELLVVAALICFATPLMRSNRRASPLNMAVLSLAGAAGLAALARVLEDLGAVGPGGGILVSETGLRAAGEVLFIVGAATAGWSGLRSARRAGAVPRLAVGAGAMVAVLVLGASTFAPSMTAMILIWSLGLSGALPAISYAAAAGLVTAGLPALAGKRRAAAVGLGIVLLAGNALSASGLLLAGLLGIAIAARGVQD